MTNIYVSNSVHYCRQGYFMYNTMIFIFNLHLVGNSNKQSVDYIKCTNIHNDFLMNYEPLKY